MINANPLFKAEICGFKDMPTEKDIEDKSSSCTSVSSFKISTKDNYEQYQFDFSLMESTKYLLILVQNYNQLDYLDIMLYGAIEYEPKIYDIPYKKEYELNSTDIEVGLIFKTLFEKEENGNVQLKINKNYYPNNKIRVLTIWFEEEPKSMYDIKQKSDTSVELELQSLVNEGNYTTLVYPYEKLKGSNYFVVGIGTEIKFDYLSIYIGPKETEESSPKEKDDQKQNYSESSSFPIWLIILIAVLYTIVLLVAFYFILRKFGYSKKGESSKEITQDYALQPDN